ncbi:MAG: DUF3822 family protein [Bacteroidales bacterium]|nr:DUF3822 family protein [Bacteroidales bacterium]
MVDPAKTLSYNITIQCALDGFCFVLHDLEENRIVDLELYQTADRGDESAIMESLEKLLFKKELLGKPCRSVRFIVGNRYNTIVPTEVFDEKEMESYIRFNHDLPVDITLFHDALASINAENVYAMPSSQVSRIRQLFDKVIFAHQSSIFLKAILQEPVDDPVNLFVNVNSRSFDLAIVKEGKLLFFNNFKFNTKDDFLYFLMFSLEQQQLTGQDLPVYFTGLISGNSEIIKLCERYIKRIRFIRPDGSVNVDMSLSGTPFHYYYIPYKSIACES